MLGFNQVHDDLVVEVLDVLPLDALSLVLLLFLFQHQLNEELLKLFITVVDAELFKALKIAREKSISVCVIVYIFPHPTPFHFAKFLSNT